jgi:hypothetical protein
VTTRSARARNINRVDACLQNNPRVTINFTPTSCSWLNMVEIFFCITTCQPSGTFIDVADLQGAIPTYIDGYNDRAQPFTWTKTTDTSETSKPNR